MANEEAKKDGNTRVGSLGNPNKMCFVDAGKR